ncbi:MAG: YdcF family protein [Clostridia bacterium]|nr:YdcF family protein [Clostridia bacterium]
MSNEKKKPKLAFRFFRFLLICGLCMVLLTAAINAYVILSTRNKILTLQDVHNLDVDCVLVLGAGLRRDGTPSHMLADRLKVGIGAYNAGAAPKLLMSGDHGRTAYNEVQAMKTFAMERNVPSPDIFMDHAGFSTYESMYRARDIFQAESLLIVTQRYHLYRAIYNAERMGLEAYGVPSCLRPYTHQFQFDVREYLARVKDFIFGIVQPHPTYLGEAIPVWGNGDVTNDQSIHPQGKE